MKRAKIGVFSNILKQMNAKVRQDLYRLSLPTHLKNTMIVGVDAVNEGRQSLLGFAASYSNYLTQYFSRVIPHEQFKDLIKKEGKDKQEMKLTESRTLILRDQMVEALKNYQEFNKGALPDQIIVYRDGVGGPTMEAKVGAMEIP